MKGQRKVLLLMTTSLCYKVKEVELKSAMVDPGSSLNIISLYVLNVEGVPRDNIMRQTIEVSRF